MIQMLVDAGPAGVTSREFNDIPIYRYSARIKDLRDSGYVIETRRDEGSLFRFILHGTPEAVEPVRAAEEAKSSLPEPEPLFDIQRDRPGHIDPDQREAA